MIHTDGRRTIANAPARAEQIPGQMTVEDCIQLAKSEELEKWEQEQREAEPVYGGF